MNDVDENLEKDAMNIPDDQLFKIAKARSGKSEKTEIKTTRYKRDIFVSLFSKKRSKGYCDLCGMKAPFIDNNGFPYLECHHLIWLSRGGTDSIDNVAALCPNCHRKMHILNMNEDVEKIKENIIKKQTSIL